jgi:MarR family transcriptional regulator, temperature-dependent positive regulator of motility
LRYFASVFDGCLYFNGTALARLLERQWTQAFAAFELSPPQGFMVRLVIERPGLLQRELAEALTISRPTATRLLDGLERKGLVRRATSESDGRECAIHPTAAGLTIGPALNAASGQVTRRLKQLLGAESFDQTVSKIRLATSRLKA